LTGPLAVATKKLTSGFLEKPRPLMVKFAPTSTGLVRLLITGWPGNGVGVGTGTVGIGVVATHSRGVGFGVGVRVCVAVRVGSGVGVCVGTSVGVGVTTTTVEVAVGRRVGVAVGLAVKVGMKVGGPVTLNPSVAVEASRLELPAKLAVSDVSSGVAGVNVHDALPLEFVVAVQELPSNVIVTLSPMTGAGGVDDTSLSEAINVTGLPAITVVGLRLNVRKVVCGPAVQVIKA
jgi:hypothetical protein